MEWYLSGSVHTMHVSCVCATEYYIILLGHTGPSVFDLGQLRTLSTARSSLLEEDLTQALQGLWPAHSDLPWHRLVLSKESKEQLPTRHTTAGALSRVWPVSPSAAFCLPLSWLNLCQSPPRPQMRTSHHSFVHSFIRSFIRFNSIQFDSIQFIHTFTYICNTSTPWGREGFQPKRGYKQLQTELRNHRICNDEHLFLNNSSIRNVQLCVINYTPQD